MNLAVFSLYHLLLMTSNAWGPLRPFRYYATSRGSLGPATARTAIGSISSSRYMVTGSMDAAVVDTTTVSGAEPSAIDSFIKEIQKSIQATTLISVRLCRVRLGKKIPGETVVPNQTKDVSIRLLKVNSGLKLQFAYRQETNLLTKNFSLEEGELEIKKLLESKAYQVGSLKTTSATAQINLKRGKGKFRVIESNVEEELVIEGNDKVKRHIVDIASPFLSMLNVTTQAGLIKSGMTAKYGQIQKFVEIVDNLVSKHSRRLTPEGKKRLNIVDMGCGLGYLTFACHQHFSKQFEVHTTGIETRFSLVERTNSIVKALQMNNIEFVTGTIETAKVDNMDVLIALHACDTATDDSLYQGVTIGAEIILVAPCCHKEVRRQIDLLKSVDNTAISNILSHGIYRERMAEMVTDTCRALLLEIAGYDTNVFEFIGGEHTAKNVMITAVKLVEPRSSQETEALVIQYRALTKEYGIKTLKLASLLKLT